jgi:Ala-tRNA(Pro) deacylase
MATATWIKDMLEQRGVAFEETHHREAFTSQEVAQSEHISGHRLAKVVAVVADGQLIELVLPASRRVALEKVRHMLGADQVRLASEAEMDRVFDDVETGAIPALRHWRGIEVIMDEAMRTSKPIVLQAGTHQDTISLDFDEWYRMVQPRVGAFSEPRLEPPNHRF